MFAAEIRKKFFTRHLATVSLLQFFSDEHLQPELKEIIKPVRTAAFAMVDLLPDGPELATGIRALIDAKNAFIRQYLVAIDFKLTPPRLMLDNTEKPPVIPSIPTRLPYAAYNPEKRT